MQWSDGRMQTIAVFVGAIVAMIVTGVLGLARRTEPEAAATDGGAQATGRLDPEVERLSDSTVALRAFDRLADLVEEGRIPQGDAEALTLAHLASVRAAGDELRRKLRSGPAAHK